MMELELRLLVSIIVCIGALEFRRDLLLRDSSFVRFDEKGHIMSHHIALL